MGSSPSKVHDENPLDSPVENRFGDHATLWRKEGYHEDYTKSPLLPDDRDDITEYVELLAMLHSPAGQNFLGKFSMEIGTQNVLFLWSDIQEYRAIPTVDYRFTRANQILRKYLQNSAMQPQFVPEKVCSDVHKCIEQARDDKALLGQEFFLEVQKICFRQIFDHTFSVLKKEHGSRYNSYLEDGAEHYNRIDVDDFEYMEKLGEGAFGKVVHVAKKSTGRHYAMKIQRKRELLRSFANSPSKLDNEKMVFQACHHPFVLHMDYAFQTEQYAIIVLNLITTGNLQDAIDSSPKRRLEEPRAKFYTAEIALALMHLHDMGLMYRDLKPRNVMLGMDGHIQLADMGGVGDCVGDMSVRKIRKHGATITRSVSLKNFKRRSIMGTKGYMAPEMAKLLNQGNEDRQGYNEAVDWWSLGVTTYKMLTGLRPFDPPPWARKKSVLVLLRRQTEFEKLQAGVQYPRYLSEPAVAFVSALLRHEVDQRLGSGPTGKADIKSHRFMEGIRWERLGAKTVEPPYIPPKRVLQDQPLYESFDDMMDSMQESDGRFSMKRISMTPLTPEEQKWFASWRYISPQTLRVEMGISKAMEDIDVNFKLMQLTGEHSYSMASASSSRALKMTGKAVMSITRVLSNLGSNASNATVAAGGETAPGSPQGPPPFVKIPTIKSLGSFSHGLAAPKPDQHHLQPIERPVNRPRITLKPPHL